MDPVLAASFGNIMVWVIVAVLFIPPFLIGFMLSRGGIRESNVKFPCPHCGCSVRIGFDYCPNPACGRKQPPAATRSGYVKAGAGTKGGRFFLGFVVTLVAEVILAACIAKLFVG